MRKIPTLVIALLHKAKDARAVSRAARPPGREPGHVLASVAPDGEIELSDDAVDSTLKQASSIVREASAIDTSHVLNLGGAESTAKKRVVAVDDYYHKFFMCLEEAKTKPEVSCDNIVRRHKATTSSNGKLVEVAAKKEKDFEAQMRDKLDMVFNHQTRGSDRVDIQFASPGSWRSSEHCKSPLLWIFLVGQYRSFGVTHSNLLKMAESSANGCFFVSAVIPEEPCALDKCDGEQFSKIDVHQSLIGMQRDVFSGRMAYVIVNRTGLYDRPFGSNEQWNDTFVPPSMLPSAKMQNGSTVLQPRETEYKATNLQGAFDFYWYSVYQCAALASKLHGITPLPYSIVLRTRPDIAVTNSFDFTNLMNYFREVQRGYHLMLGGETVKRQADCYMITSFQGYKTNIAEAYEHSVWTARSNGAGYGWSICGWRSPCSIEQAGGRVWLKGPEADNPASCKTRPLNYNDKNCCSGGSCAMRLLVNSKFGYWPIVRTERDSEDRSFGDHKIDLTQGVQLVCPSRQDSFSAPSTWGGSTLPLYGNDEDRWAIEEGRTPFPVYKVDDGGFYMSTHTFNLVQGKHLIDVWPQGC